MNGYSPGDPSCASAPNPATLSGPYTGSIGIPELVATAFNDASEVIFPMSLKVYSLGAILSSLWNNEAYEW